MLKEFYYDYLRTKNDHYWNNKIVAVKYLVILFKSFLIIY